MLIAFLISSVFEYASLGIRPRSEREQVQAGLGQALSGSPSLIINV